MRNHRIGRSRLFRRLALGLVVAVVAAPPAQARIDDSSPAQPDRTAATHPDSRALPPRPGVNPRAVPKDSRGAPAVAVSEPEGFDWGDTQMALAGMAVAGVLIGAGLLLTLREARRIA
jgi:hypothetical protein